MLYICTTAVGKYSFSIQKNKFREGVVRAARDLSTDRSDSLTWQILKNETHVYLWCYIADGDGSGAQRIYISLFFMCAPAENASSGLNVYVRPVAGAE